MVVEEKVCAKCNKSKPYTEFHKDRTQKDGFKKICKPCRSDVQKEYRSKAPEDTTRLDIERARLMAIKVLIERHRNEYLHLFAASKRKLGIKSNWIEVK